MGKATRTIVINNNKVNINNQILNVPIFFCKFPEVFFSDVF